MTDPDLSRGSPNDVDHQNDIERRTVTCGMVTAALAAVGEFDVSLSSMRRREVTRMIQAALDWKATKKDDK